MLDPDGVLANARAAKVKFDQALSADEQADAGVELADAFEALDECLSKWLLPADWAQRRVM
jgi:hypothetical protein